MVKYEKNRLKKILLGFGGILLVVLSAFTPQILDQVYSLKGLPITITTFEKSELLAFYGSHLAFVDTIILGVVAVSQNQKANNISKELMRIEQNRFRPYIKLKIEKQVFIVNKDAFDFSEDAKKKIAASDIFYHGIVNPNKIDTNNFDGCYPTVFVMFLECENIGESNIISLFPDKFVVSDGIVGRATGFKSTIDTTLMSKQSKRITVSLTSPVPISQDPDRLFDNVISKQHKNLLSKAVRIKHIAITLNYFDSFGREYYQDYTLGFQYDLESENEYEYIFTMKNITVQMHTDPSPYTRTPRSNIKV